MTTETFTARTPGAIVARIKEIETADFFGAETSDILVYLPFIHAQPFLKDGVTSEEWAKSQKINNRETILAEILDYMPFAWEKANDCRGLSAGRSISHMRAWLWLLGDELAGKIDDYSYYGKPELRAICEKYGFNWKEWDNGEWREYEDGPFLTPEEVEGV